MARKANCWETFLIPSKGQKKNLICLMLCFKTDWLTQNITGNRTFNKNRQKMYQVTEQQDCYSEGVLHVFTYIFQPHCFNHNDPTMKVPFYVFIMHLNHITIKQHACLERYISKPSTSPPHLKMALTLNRI